MKRLVLISLFLSLFSCKNIEIKPEHQKLLESLGNNKDYIVIDTAYIDGANLIVKGFVEGNTNGTNQTLKIQKIHNNILNKISDSIYFVLESKQTLDGKYKNESNWIVPKWNNNDTLLIQLLCGSQSSSSSSLIMQDMEDVLSNKYLVTIKNNKIEVLSNTFLSSNKIKDNLDGELKLISYSFSKLPIPGELFDINLKFKNFGTYLSQYNYYYREDFNNYIIYGNRQSTYTIYGRQQIYFGSFYVNEEKNIKIIFKIKDNAKKGDLLPIRINDSYNIYIKVN